MSLSVLEALACGLPVIGSATACATVVEHGVHGFQLQGGSPEEIAGYVNRLFGEPAPRRTMAGRARLRAQEFSSDRAVDGYIDVYERVAGRNRRA